MKVIANPIETIRKTNDLKTFKGWHIFHNSWNPISDVVNVDRVEYIFCGISNKSFDEKQKTMFIQTEIAAGTETFIILDNNELFIADEFGSKASKNDGTPIVNVLTKVIWIGSNG